MVVTGGGNDGSAAANIVEVSIVDLHCGKWCLVGGHKYRIPCSLPPHPLHIASCVPGFPEIVFLILGSIMITMIKQMNAFGNVQFHQQSNHV